MTDTTALVAEFCTKVSRGCDRCYAEGLARRFAGTKAYPNGFEVTLRPRAARSAVPVAEAAARVRELDI